MQYHKFATKIIVHFSFYKFGKKTNLCTGDVQAFTGMHASIVFWLVVSGYTFIFGMTYTRLFSANWLHFMTISLGTWTYCRKRIYLVFKILFSFFSYFHAVISKTTWYVVDYIGCVVVKWLHSLRVTRVFLASSFWFPFPDYHLSSTFLPIEWNCEHG